MNKVEIFKTLKKYKKILEEMGYRVLYIGLYGSQNYNLDDEFSDIDAKAIVLPTLKDIIFKQTISTPVETETGNIDVKDLITFYSVIKKGNFSYIESIQTEYFIGDKDLKLLLSKIPVNLKSIKGAMLEKRKALTHEYPTKKVEFEKWGFDPKQAHHILRLYDMLNFGAEKGYIAYSDSSFRNQLLELKRNLKNKPLEEIASLCDGIISFAETCIPTDYQYTQINLDEEINKYVEKEIKLELFKKKTDGSARQYRTFDGSIPKSDLKKFPEVLELLQGQDISYIVYEILEVL